ncbi:hypothetical protein [Haloarchaeobius litoreus]|uniref:Uncharacterized protein n=1 Tax=Haloarchaeobius litoreus TaxID=755306 RepID=A0ABD6DG02_9EURY|nr:hypothetical protein [Haloarchaeobius litoreus]
MASHRPRRLVLAAFGTLLLATGTVLAHGGSLRGEAATIAVPAWLFLLTGGAAVGASFLLAATVTDRRYIASIDDWHRTLRRFPVAVSRYLAPLVGVVGFVAVLWFGFTGPTTPLRNLSVLLVWVGWWAGFTMTTYLVGNTWRALNPFRALVRAVHALVGGPAREYPDRLGSWPAVVGLLALVFTEVVLPLADDPRLLATAVTGYGFATTLAGLVFGETWFDRGDPVSRTFAAFGAVAPLVRTDDGVRLRLPGMGLTDSSVVRDRSDVTFVVTLLWVTTYDGLVTTPFWGGFATTVVEAGVPALLTYLLAYLLGFGVFVGVYLLAAWLARLTGETFLTPDALGRRFAAPLLAIAAGYHLAHYLSYFVVLSLPLSQVLANPTAPPLNPQRFGLPAFVGGLELAFVLLGHLLAIWVAHSTAYDTFPSRLQAIRSQYPFIGVMVVYTMVSLWIVAAPARTPPFL